MHRRGRGFFADAFAFMLFVGAIILVWGIVSYALAYIRPKTIDPAVSAWPSLGVLFQRLDWQWVWIPVVIIVGGIIYIIVRAQDTEGNMYRI